MSYYSPIEPNPKKPDDLPVGRIIAIVVLFSIGLWPVAVYLIWKTVSESKRPQKRIPPKRVKRPDGKIYGEYVPYEPKTPPAGVPNTSQRQKAAPPPAPQQPVPQHTAEDRPATQSAANISGVKKPWWYTALGALGIGMIAVGSLSSFLGLASIFGGGSVPDTVAAFIISGLAVVSGGCFLMVPRSMALQEAKKIRFCNVVGTRKVMKLADMAATLGVTYPQLVKELQRHLDKGLFPGGYIDHARKLLVVSAQGVDLTALEDKPISDKSDNDGAQPDSRRDMLAKIRMVNKRIADESVSKKVRRIEEITALILEAVERDPAKERKIGVFMSYYLPTTLKIITAYEQFEEQGVRGENLQAAMRDIESILDHLVLGFERQLDLLFEKDVLDISSDISVLESMLAKDGLTDNDLTMPKG
ncbi:5-bromo-4-chloroindolyl phosphate hydrolysis family protein [Oscillospiraceae bacterium LTW-04]|nr:5-bromo-4-chloroindolyl phosphate hydrolysis family protein [Oscillospiraceae bacterium MB24-C1]